MTTDQQISRMMRNLFIALDSIPTTKEAQIEECENRRTALYRKLRTVRADSYDYFDLKNKIEKIEAKIIDLGGEI